MPSVKSVSWHLAMQLETMHRPLKPSRTDMRMLTTRILHKQEMSTGPVQNFSCTPR